MALSATAIRNAKPTDRAYKLADGGGLYLLVRPDGARYWRLKYRYAGKEKLLALGVFPEVSLAEARDARDEAKRMLRDRKDPSAERRAHKRLVERASANTFKALAQDWLKATRNKWTPSHADRIRASLELNLYDEIGSRPVTEITPRELLAALRKIEARGAYDMAHRVQNRASAIFRYAIAEGRSERDPAADLRSALVAPERRNYSALGQKDLPEFYSKLAEYQGEAVTKLALRLLALTFVRTIELRGAEWSEIDFDAEEWRIPGERMKSGELHIVPLSRQTLGILEELKASTGSGRFLFPHRTNPTKPMSENTILFALYRMGYHSRATGHGFRATASTILNELGFPADAIERQLAHAPRNKVRAAYNRAQYLPERRRMMQEWADLLGVLATGDKKVIAGRFGKAA